MLAKRPTCGLEWLAGGKGRVMVRWFLAIEDVLFVLSLGKEQEEYWMIVMGRAKKFELLYEC